MQSIDEENTLKSDMVNLLNALADKKYAEGKVTAAYEIMKDLVENDFKLTRISDLYNQYEKEFEEFRVVFEQTKKDFALYDDAE